MSVPRLGSDGHHLSPLRSFSSLQVLTWTAYPLPGTRSTPLTPGITPTSSSYPVDPCATQVLMKADGIRCVITAARRSMAPSTISDRGPYHLDPVISAGIAASEIQLNQFPILHSSTTLPRRPLPGKYHTIAFRSNNSILTESPSFVAS